MPIEPPGHEFLLSQLRDQISEGFFPQSDRMDLQLLADRFGVSVTPVREALFELIGERLVEHHPFGGFQPATHDPVKLMHLYAWSGHHLLAALHLLPEPVIRKAIAPIAEMVTGVTAFDPRVVIERFAAGIGEATGNGEFISQIEALNWRLRRARLVEPKLFGDRDRELVSLVRSNGLNVRKNVRRRLTAYHRRRIENAAQIAALIS